MHAMASVSLQDDSDENSESDADDATDPDANSESGADDATDGFVGVSSFQSFIGHSILRTQVKPLSHSLVLLSSHFLYQSGIDPCTLSIFENLNFLDSSKGCSAQYHSQGGWYRHPPRPGQYTGC